MTRHRAVELQNIGACDCQSRVWFPTAPLART
jgi:hypothetical protein